jgi:hypothetical protein
MLSHTWGRHEDEDEVSFKDIFDGEGKDKAGYRKFRFCYDEAASDRLQYLWMDTCCIRNVTQMTMPYESRGS